MAGDRSTDAWLKSLDDARNWTAIRFNRRQKYSARRRISGEFTELDFDTRIEIPGEQLTLVRTKSLTARRRRSLLDRIAAHGEIEFVSSTRQHGSTLVAPTDRLLVGLPAGPGSRARLSGLRKDYSLGAPERIGDTMVFQRSGSTPIDVLERLAGDKRVEFAETDVANVGPDSVSQPLLQAASESAGDQHALSELNVHAAWARQQGDPRIRIAILDTGIARSHPDLRDAYGGGYDAVRQEEEVVVDPLDGHGTACAGLAAGAGHGVSGSGRGCSLLGVRIALRGGIMAAPAIVTNNILRGLEWAVQVGNADILSLSFFTAPSIAIRNALDKALTSGRGGRGTVIVAAAGNRPGPVMFPARHPGVIAVSALDRDLLFKTPAADDVPAPWGSASGPEIAIAAPGVRNLSTDIPGPFGLSSTDFVVFNGTSSCAPLVAGVCGLLLSANPALAASDVRRILVQTARTAGAGPMANGRNDEVGAGIVDAFAAVSLALNS